MPTPTDVVKRMTVENEHDAEWLRGCYNMLLLHSFEEVPFIVVWTPHDASSHSHFTVSAKFSGYLRKFKPVFIFFVIAKSASRSSVARQEAEEMLKRLLREADTPITIIHGACVAASRIAFYRYDRNLDVFTPESHLQGQFNDFDLTEERGAVRYLQAVDEVKACREAIKTMEACRWERASWMERFMIIVFGWK
jgi:hypothetical protein